MDTLVKPMTDRQMYEARDADAVTALDRVKRLEEALSRALAYCDAAHHEDSRYHDERGEFIRVLQDH